MALRQPRAVAPLTEEELENLPTHRILAYLDKLHACENSVHESGFELNEIIVEGIIFKDDEKWKKQYDLVKGILSARPNVEKHSGK